MLVAVKSSLWYQSGVKILVCVVLLKVIFLFNSVTGAGKSISTPQDLFRSSGKALMKRQHQWCDLCHKIHLRIIRKSVT